MTNMTFLPMSRVNDVANIKVIGVGGGGGNAVRHMVEKQLDDVGFLCANTDAQALLGLSDCESLQLGTEITKGLGAGADPEVGRRAAMEDRDTIREAIAGSDMLFITAGMGGGTGTGAAPIVAQVAKEMDILTVAVITKPFPFEGNKRMKVAIQGINELRECVDSLITIPNEKLLTELGKNISLLNAFSEANDVLFRAVQGISELITRPGLINVDFADVRTVMAEMGMAMMGAGSAEGENRAQAAAEKAIHSPLLEDISLQGARGILVNVTAGMDLQIGEFEEVGNMVREFASEDATVVVGTVIEPEMEKVLRVTLVATGLDQPSIARQPAPNVTPIQRTSQGAVDYAVYERPAVNRQSASNTTGDGHSAAAQPGDAPPAAPTPASKPASANGSLDYLDIPAFLRRQAD